MSYYAAPTAMTDLPTIDGLNPSPQALAQVVRGLLVHRDWLPLLGLSFGPDRLADQHIRPARVVVDRVLELDARPLTASRDAKDRMVSVCRHFAVVHVALLRQCGIPARARVGFGGYFGPRWDDHWITEWWDGSRWVRHDAQIGGRVRELLHLDFDPADQPPGRFLTGAEAWLACRRGSADPCQFGIFDMRGLWFVHGNVLLDLAALNKIELLPWDVLGNGPSSTPSEEELREIDRVAEVIVADELAGIEAEYRRQPLPPVITSLIDGVATLVDIGELLITTG